MLYRIEIKIRKLILAFKIPRMFLEQLCNDSRLITWRIILLVQVLTFQEFYCHEKDQQQNTAIVLYSSSYESEYDSQVGNGFTTFELKCDGPENIICRRRLFNSSVIQVQCFLANFKRCCRQPTIRARTQLECLSRRLCCIVFWV